MPWRYISALAAIKVKIDGLNAGDLKTSLSRAYEHVNQELKLLEA